MRLFNRGTVDPKFGELCKECKRPLKWGHTLDCKNITYEELQKQLKVYREQLAFRDRDMRWWRDQARIWEGKFRTVTHENNQLRKKLRAND